MPLKQQQEAYLAVSSLKDYVYQDNKANSFFTTDLREYTKLYI